MRYLWTVLWVGLACTAGARPAPLSSTRYDLTPLASATGGLIPLVGGRSISLPPTWSRRRIYFEDLAPGANWQHAARIVLEHSDGRIEMQIPLTLPPKDLANCEVVWGTAPVPTGVLEFKVADLGGTHKVADPNKYWALLLNGHAEQRHWNDFAFLYRVLVHVYGYLPSHIIVADSVFQNRMPDLDGNGTSDIGYGSTYDDVKKAIGFLGGAMKKTDRLLFVVNDHGGIIDGESTVVFYDTEIKAKAFLPLIQGLPCQELIAVYEQCNAGGFVRPTTGPGRVALSASTDLEISWATIDFRFDEFLYHFTSAIGYQRHDGTAVSADTDGDGRISVKEAFIFAQAADKAPESPFLESQTNSGKAADVGVGY